MAADRYKTLSAEEWDALQAPVSVDNGVEVINYDAIKELGRETGSTIKDLLALSPANDPFYAGTPAGTMWAEWFVALWQQLGYDQVVASGRTVHIRRMHYALASSQNRVKFPPGAFSRGRKPKDARLNDYYQNHPNHYHALAQASKYARYLGKINPAWIHDAKNPDAKQNLELRLYGPSISVYNSTDFGVGLDLGSFPSVPLIELSDYKSYQKYHIVVVCEKSTVDDVLEPLHWKYEIDIQTATGELSLTKAFELFERIKKVNKPTVILYISDFDPSGRTSMPVAFSRKLEFYMRNKQLDLNVRLYHVALTEDQVNTLRLPRIPTKTTDLKTKKFEETFGAGQTELDALEAIYPGKLREILVDYIERFYDTTLDQRTEEAKKQLEDDLYAIKERVYEKWEDEVSKKKEEWDAAMQKAQELMESEKEDVEGLFESIEEDLEEEKPDIEDYPLPEQLEQSVDEEALYDSSRTYTYQLDNYTSFTYGFDDEEDGK